MGFTAETFEFLADIEKNNSKEWFEANRDRYEAHWKDAALDFIADIAGDMAKLSPSLKAEPKLNGSLRRINRDVRFSADKSPYKPRLQMVFWTGGKPTRSPAMHVVLHPSGVGYGAGRFGLEPKELGAIRDRIVGPDGDALIAALAEARKVHCEMTEPALARLPRGYEAEGERAELLRHKAIVARTVDHQAPTSVMIGAGARNWVMETTKALLPLIRWLEVN